MKDVRDSMLSGFLQSVCDELCVKLSERMFALKWQNLSSSNGAQVRNNLRSILDEMTVLFLLSLVHDSSVSVP